MLAKTGSTTIGFAGIFGKLLLISFQLMPPSVVRKTCPRSSTKPEKPDSAKQAVVEVCGATATCDTYRRAGVGQRGHSFVGFTSRAVTTYQYLPWEVFWNSRMEYPEGKRSTRLCLGTMCWLRATMKTLE